MTSQRLPVDLRTQPLPPIVPLIFAVLLGVALLVALLPVAASSALLAAAALGLVVLIRPWLGLPLLAVVVPFAALRPLPVGGLPIDAADLLLAWVLVAWLAQGVAQRRIVVPQPPLLWPMLGLLAALGLSLLGAQSYRDGLSELLKWVQVLALYLAVAAILPRSRAGWLLAGLLVAAAAQALLGIYQFVTQTGPEPFILLGRFMRAYGAFRQPNPYAGYLGLIAPLAISLALWAWTGGARASWRLRGILLATAGLISLGLLVSWSRGAWLSFAVAVAVVVLAHTRRAAPVVAVLAALAALVMVVFGVADLLPASIVSRLTDLQEYAGLIDVARTEVTDANFSVIERIAHWQAALGMWTDHPWLGVGAGNYAAAYAGYNLPRWYEPLGHAHNVYLNVAAEAGLLGLLAYLWLWAASLWQALRAAAAGDRWTAAVGAGVLGALVHATVHNLFDNLWVQHIYLNLALLLGLLVVLSAPHIKPGVRNTACRNWPTPR